MDVAPLDMPILDELTASGRALVAEAGARWRFSVDGPWAHATPAGVEPPEQGWKLHISATGASAADVLAATVPVLLAEDVPFKFAAGQRIVRLLNSTHADRASGGKFLTVYPADDAQAVRIAEACHRATEGLTGPVILSDRVYRPGSLVHYRYGGFSAAPTVDADGVVVHLIKGPDGTPLADERTASYRAPSWLVDPFQPAPAARPAAPAPAPAPAGATVVLNGRYRIQGALSHANKGGTYLAEDSTTGALVVIKEGRPHVGDEGQGDARARVRHEARMLTLVEWLGRAPRLVEVFEQGGHVFLVEEYVDAPSLREVVEGDTGGPSAPLPAEEMLDLAIALAETLAAFHAAGIVVGDFNPNNILVTDDGAVVVIDLEHARPASEHAVGPAGTPGYASPEQLRGVGAGETDDCWSLGATIAYLATGADPFLPAGADDTWSDSSRVTAWLGSQVAAGAVDAALAGVALGAMAPRPTDRLSPVAVLTTLRGEGSRTAPGRGGLLVPPSPAASTDTEAQAADVVVDIARWLFDTMGTGPAGHLWPAGAAAASLDPIAVQAGASGVGLFLAQLLRAADDLPEAARRRLDVARLREALSQTAAWVADQLARNPQRPPGLYFGTSGVAWFLAEAAGALGRDDLLRRANELALTIPVRVPNSDITHGTAGLGLGQLQQWLVTGDDRFLARAVVAGEQVLRAASRLEGAGTGAGVTWPVPGNAPTRLAGTVSYGYAHGNAGIATFLFALSAAIGEPAFAAMATEALLTVLPQAVSIDGAAYWPASPDAASDSSESGYWPSWCNGSSGMGTAFLRAHVATGDPVFRVAAEAAAKAGLRERWRSTAGQCHGLAGDAELLLDLVAMPARQVPPGDPGRRAALDAAEALLLQRRTAATRPGAGARNGPPPTIFADDSGATLSAGFGTGMAGTGAFLLRLVTGGPRLLMLDALTSGGTPETPRLSGGDPE
ncbi:MAG TPA: class IV lanthionine synthetase LanL [Acidimicrobiia bacterium]|nr:class IV lanthionine synthetase LanL [Acidimicrobiia bacterium]